VEASKRFILSSKWLVLPRPSLAGFGRPLTVYDYSIRFLIAFSIALQLAALPLFVIANRKERRTKRSE